MNDKQKLMQLRREYHAMVKVLEAVADMMADAARLAKSKPMDSELYAAVVELIAKAKMK